MIKARIMINTECDYHNDVSTIINLVAIPKAGDFLWLTGETLRHLEELATKDIERARTFAPTWFYGESNGVTYESVEEKDFDNLTFDDMNTVHEVWYHDNLDYVTIIMKASYH